MLDHSELKKNRERSDRAAKEAALKQMSKRKEEGKPPVCAPLVTLRELAGELNMDRSAARRYVLRLGHKPMRARTAESGYQQALVFTREQADAIVAARRADGYC